MGRNEPYPSGLYVILIPTIFMITPRHRSCSSRKGCLPPFFDEGLAASSSEALANAVLVIIVLTLLMAMGTYARFRLARKWKPRFESPKGGCASRALLIAVVILLMFGAISGFLWVVTT
jgi:amino acid transporter